MLMLYSSGPQPFWHQGWFWGIQFFHGLAGGQSRGEGGDCSVVQAHHIYCVLYDYYISSTSDHQALDGRSWGPLHTEFLSQARSMWDTIQRALMRDGDGIRVLHVIVRLSLLSQMLRCKYFDDHQILGTEDFLVMLQALFAIAKSCDRQMYNFSQAQV